MSGGQVPTSGDELLAMSDDDIMNMTAPPEAGESQGQGGTQTETETATGTGTGTETGEQEQTELGDTDSAAQQEEVTDKPDGEAETDTKAAGQEADDASAKDDKTEAPAKPEGEAKTEPKEKPDASPTGSNEGVVAEPTPEQATAFYKQVMAPFKANGKMIQLKDPSEAIQLMQMGANYTRKLQDIQPHRKVLLMLQNNDLLDEGKLSYLIDLDKKNPEAIKKLIKDAGIDPLDIDTSTEPAYLEGNHRVTDEEAGFRQALDELISTQNGMETVQLINTDWDQASKEVLWQSPEIMTVIHEQRENGVYDVITAELDRQKTLGKIPPNTPFLQAYKIVGDELAAAGTFGDPGGEQKQLTVVTTRAAAPKSTVTNGDRASAASPTRTTPRKAETLVNPLAMSDDEFLSQMNGRL